MIYSSRRLLSLSVFMLPSIAWAHPEVIGTADFLAGLLHPITGIDHVLAMVAVGIYAARYSRGLRWLAPASFMTVMLLGAAFGALTSAFAVSELAIAGSVMLFGVAVMSRRLLPAVVTVPLFGAFALFHGIAHGTEAAVAPGMGYFTGMVLATGALHALGLALASLVVTRWGDAPVRVAGSTIALSGVALLFAV